MDVANPMMTQGCMSQLGLKILPWPMPIIEGFQATIKSAAIQPPGPLKKSPKSMVSSLFEFFIHPHQKCGYSDLPFSRGYTFSILQGPETDLREWKRCVDSHKNRKPSQKDTFFLWKNVLRAPDKMKNTCRICWNR